MANVSHKFPTYPSCAVTEDTNAAQQIVDLRFNVHGKNKVWVFKAALSIPRRPGLFQRQFQSFRSPSFSVSLPGEGPLSLVFQPWWGLSRVVTWVVSPPHRARAQLRVQKAQDQTNQPIGRPILRRRIPTDSSERRRNRGPRAIFLEFLTTLGRHYHRHGLGRCE